MAIDKIEYADIIDGVTDGYAASLLVNENKKITNSLVDTVNTYISGALGTAAYKNIATTAEAIAGTPDVLPDAAGVKSHLDSRITTSSTDTTPNKLMKVRDFGLGATDRSHITIITTDAAANSLVLPAGSIYAFSNISTTDMPAPYGYIILEGVPNGALYGWAQQRFIEYLTGKQYTRTGLSGSAGFGPWRENLTTGNTTVDSNGFIKEASPIINLFSDCIDSNGAHEIKDVQFEKTGKGIYLLLNCPEFSDDGWYLEQPRDRNGDVYHNADWAYNVDTMTLTINTYERVFNSQNGKFENGQPVDIPEGRFISLRFKEEYPINENQ